MSLRGRCKLGKGTTEIFRRLLIIAKAFTIIFIIIVIIIITVD